MSPDRTAHSGRTGSVSSRAPRLPWVPRLFQLLVRDQLRLRVLIATVLVTLVALAAFDLAAITTLRAYLMHETDTALRTAVLAARPQLTGPDGENEISAWISTHQFLVGDYNILYVPNAGRPGGLDDGPPLPPGIGDYAPNTPVNLADLVVDGQAHTMVSVFGKPLRSVAIHAAGGALVISTSLHDIDNTAGRMWLIMLIGSVAAGLFIGLGVFWLLRRGLRPIEAMAAQADRITAGNLTDRVTEHYPRSEVGRLGSALNGMLARVEAEQESMRQFFADASHELRTPLASLRANAELYQQGALPEREQVDEAMEGIALEAQRMSGLVNDMLRLARLDQHPEQQREPVALSELIDSCVHRVRVGASQRDWHTKIANGVVVIGDEELLRRAVDNLLANVVAHTPQDASATVALRQHGDEVEVEVSDSGPGVAEGQLPRIFDRFYRAGTTTTRPGAGLGLAIVTEIVTVHNGTVVAEPNTPNGLRVRLTLPVAVVAPHGSDLRS